ncbi:hypothetical protein [Bacillus pumilus]|uniref:hypothetical protein n=1 Tax=Bacillus pumilus TaxID=1408 RepID=UPI001F4071D6|nr:hypothetical protein [Bacillus pumilus]
MYIERKKGTVVQFLRRGQTLAFFVRPYIIQFTARWTPNKRVMIRKHAASGVITMRKACHNFSFITATMPKTVIPNIHVFA